MIALLGKIISITKIDVDNASMNRFEIKFKAACVMPARTVIPEWLKDQTLTISRDVLDPRELGHPGDSIIISPDESDRWLHPLCVDPVIKCNELPDSISIRLKWWKEDKSPDYTVKANGITIIGKFEKTDDVWIAEVKTADFYSSAPKLPVDFEVTVDKMKAVSSVVRDDVLWSRKMSLPAGDRHRINGNWYVVDVMSGTFGSGIISLVEKGRGVDHFLAPKGQITADLLHIGHKDMLVQGWDSWKMAGTSMNCAGYYREGNSSKMIFDGVVDEGKGIRSSVTYTVFDDLPLILNDRRFQFAEPKKPDDPKANELPKEPIDNMIPVGFSMRPGWTPDTGPGSGSKLVFMNNEKLMEYRLVKEDYRSLHNTRLAESWILVEHPNRNENTLYFVDRKHVQYIGVCLNSYSFLIETSSPVVPLMPNSTLGFTIGLSAGELCGASTAGAWTAIRMPVDGGIRCAVIGSFKDSRQDVTMSVGDTVKQMQLMSAIIPGIGTIGYAIGDFPESTMDDQFDVIAAGIPARRMK
ncbi:MAG: hypothetical protein ACYC0V_12900 [Armatimonadota bacterium]